MQNDVATIARGPWTCFHCGETFTSEHCARLHFGRSEDSEAACIIKAGAEGSLLKALRAAEEQADDAIQAMHAESTDAARAYHAQRCRHNHALIAAEELGYERGLADARAEASDLRAALSLYGKHKKNIAGVPGGGCNGVWPFDRWPCDCGLNAALSTHLLTEVSNHER